MRNNMPNVPVNDLVLQPRENDLVLATHGRGVWILDQVNAMQELTPAIRGKKAHLFTIGDAEMTRYTSTKAHAGDMVFRGENPPNGAIIDYWVGDATDAKPTLTIENLAGTRLTTIDLPAATGSGVRRTVWNLRLPDLRKASGGGDDDDGFGGGLPGRYVAPGTYVAHLTIGGESVRQRFNVREDARVSLTPLARTQWHAALDDVAALYRSASALADSARAERQRLEKSASPDTRRLAEVRDVQETATELTARLAALYGNVIRKSEVPTTDQKAQQGYFPTVYKALQARWRALGTRS
jgi:hypothetical protein